MACIVLAYIVIVHMVMAYVVMAYFFEGILRSDLGHSVDSIECAPSLHECRRATSCKMLTCAAMLKCCAAALDADACSLRHWLLSHGPTHRTIRCLPRLCACVCVFMYMHAYRHVYKHVYGHL